ncbi:MAG: phage portal protein [Alphaproteobacteria bacterium]|nr:phage portal protein [Alphaproteobacteria bacterium]
MADSDRAAKGGGIASTIGEGILSRVGLAWKALTGQPLMGDPQVWMSAQNPIQPVVPDAQEQSVRGRQWDFPVGYNTRVQPRDGYNTTFEQLRALADSCDVLRAVIETRKDQIKALTWNVKPKDDKKAPDARCQEIEDFMAFPDGEHPFHTWLAALLEEMFVTDAACLLPQMTNAGKPFRFEWMDGTRMKIIIDEHGRTPLPPDPAYSQVMKGVPTIFYTRDELVYYPRNLRVWRLMGYSPVEQIIMTVNTAIRKALYQQQYYTDGATPDLIMSVPSTWETPQIAEFHRYWNELLSGNTSTRRQTMFVPDGSKALNTKEGVLKDEYDEWLARVICYAFSVSPQPFVKQVNRSTAETAQEMAIQEGLTPIMMWIKDLMDLLIWKYWGYQDLEFAWEDLADVDPATQNKIDDVNLKNGSRTINEVRADRGDPPIEGGDIAMCMTGTGYVPINAAVIAAQEDDSVNPEKPMQQDEVDASQPQGDKQPQQDKQAPAEKKKAKQPTQKIAKASKKLSPIDTERPEVIKERAKLTKSIQGVFSRQKNAVVKSLTKIDKADDEDDFDSLLDDMPEGDAAFLSMFGDSAQTVFKDGVMAAYTQLDGVTDDALNLANDAAIDYAKERSAWLVGKSVNDDGEIVDNPDAEYAIDDATREMLRGDIAQAMEEGWSNDQLADALSENYAFSDERAMAIARTETATADMQGNLTLYKQSGLVDKKEWVAAPDCCDECQDVDGEIVGIDESFSIGEDMPPGHVNCRCTCLPILAEDEDSEDSED